MNTARQQAATTDDFIAGVPVDFTAPGGTPLRATFRRQPLCHLRITTRDGRRVADPITSEFTARTWFLNINRSTSP